MRKVLKAVFVTGALFSVAYASGCCTVAGPGDFGSLACNVTKSTSIGKLMLGVAYLAGLGFGIAAIFKFKQHKDNPTQVPIGTPFALLAISVLLVFFPAIYAPAGKTVFGCGGGTGGALQAAVLQRCPAAAVRHLVFCRPTRIIRQPVDSRRGMFFMPKLLIASV